MILGSRPQIPTQFFWGVTPCTLKSCVLCCVFNFKVRTSLSDVIASQQCGLGSIPGSGDISGLSLLLVLVFAPRVFLRFSSLHKNLNSNSIWRQWRTTTVQMPLQIPILSYPVRTWQTYGRVTVGKTDSYRHMFRTTDQGTTRIEDTPRKSSPQDLPVVLN